MTLTDTVKVKFLGDAAQLVREAERASRALRGTGTSAQDATGHLSRMAKGLVAGASIGAAGLAIERFGKSSVNAYKDAAAEALKLNRLTGLTAEQASRLGFAAKETGQDSDNFARALGLLSKNLSNADKQQTQLVKTSHLAVVQVPKLVKGHLEYASQLKTVVDVQKKVVPGTQSLGFALRDASGHLLPLASLLPKIADKFKAMQNGPEKTALALKLFGRNGAQLLPFLNQGAAGLAKFSEEADKLGITMSGKDITAYRQYVAAQREFKAAMEGIKISLGRELFPLFTAWAQAIANNGPKINEYARSLTGNLVPSVAKVAGAFKDLRAGLKGEDTGLFHARSAAATLGESFRELHAIVKFVRQGIAGLEWTAVSLARGFLDIAGVVAKVSDKLFGTHFGGTINSAITKIKGLQAQLQASAAGVTIPVNIVVTTTNRKALNPATHAKGFIGPTIAEGLAASGVAGPYTPQQTGAKQVAAAAAAAADALHATQVRMANAAKAANDKVLQGQLDQAAAAQRVADRKQAAADALQKASDALQQALQSRLDTAKGIRDNLVNSNSIVRDGVSWTAKDLLSRFQVTMEKVKRFQAAIQALVRKGFDASIVQQVAAGGVANLGTAVALAHADTGQRNQANAIQRQIERSAGTAGAAAAGQLGPIVNVYIDGKEIAASVITKHDRALATAVNRYNAGAGVNGSLLAS